jgi:hypothetical protein
MADYVFEGVFQVRLFIRMKSQITDLILLDRSISSRLDTKWDDEVYMQDGRILLLVLVAVMTDRRKDSESIYHGANC